ncbi:MAG TPA: phage major capsid protein [Terracidiphilus sp.]|nr:phage major capsid protein [Terracidiphilus sp.]
MKLQELLQETSALRLECEAITARAEAEGRELTREESTAYNAKSGRVVRLESEIRAKKEQNTIFKVFSGPDGKFNPAMLMDAGRPNPGAAQRGQKQMSTDYTESFLAFVRSGGKQAGSALSEGFDPLFGGFALPSLPGMSAALYEGSSAAGGYAVSVPTDPLIVPLAVPDLGVRSVAKVIPTNTDIKIPSQSTFGTAGIKAESGAASNQFSESNPSLAQFTLSAWMVGLTHTVSWELLQDVATFQEFGARDLINAIDIAEDGFFVTGTGTSQPQGLIGNVGTGTGSAVAWESTGAYLLQSTLDVIGTLKAQYHNGAYFLMSRATGAAIRKAQLQSNLFAQVWTRENGRNLLHGYPVVFSSSMPSIPTSTTAGVQPILFGSFQDGYVIGDRGGSGTFIKILDQPLATAGQTVLLGYKRVDGRVRRSEAIQQISISHT